MNDLQVDILKQIENYLNENSNDLWEHQNVISIHSIDNPGWRVSIPFPPRDFSGLSEKIVIENSEDDWIHIWQNEEKNCIDIACGARNLSQSLEMAMSYLKP